ncbi:MAG: hypothetical protein ACLRYY_12190 [Anaerobutyricum soehngenii]
MLKRVLVFLVIVGCVSQFCAGINSYAREVNDSNAVVEASIRKVEGYIESTVVLDSQVGYARSSTVSGKKEYSYKSSSGKIIWTAVLHGNFTYNGTSAKCTTTSVRVNISNNN